MADTGQGTGTVILKGLCYESENIDIQPQSNAVKNGKFGRQDAHVEGYMVWMREGQLIRSNGQRQRLAIKYAGVGGEDRVQGHGATSTGNRHPLHKRHKMS